MATGNVICEFGRCGTLGARDAKRKRRARIEIETADQNYRVCESCADLLTRELREAGVELKRQILVHVETLSPVQPRKARRPAVKARDPVQEKKERRKWRKSVKRLADLPQLASEIRALGHAVEYGIGTNGWIFSLDKKVIARSTGENGLAMKVASWLIEYRRRSSGRNSVRRKRT